MEGLQDGSTQGPSDFLLYPQGCASERYWDLELLVMSVSLSHLFSLTMPTIPHTLPQAELCPRGSHDHPPPHSLTRHQPFRACSLAPQQHAGLLQQWDIWGPVLIFWGTMDSCLLCSGSWEC